VKVDDGLRYPDLVGLARRLKRIEDGCNAEAGRAQVIDVACASVGVGVEPAQGESGWLSATRIQQ